MSEPLTPCPTCQRHLRDSEEACPFCSAPRRPGAAGRLAAAAGLTAAVLTGCPDSGRMVVEYGAPPMPAPVQTNTKTTSPPDAKTDAPGKPPPPKQAPEKTDGR